MKWLFFDIDNTLFNSKELALRARQNAVEEMIDAGLPVKSVSDGYAKLRKIIDKTDSNASNHFNLLAEEYKVGHKSHIVAAGVVAYHDTKFAYLKPFPDVVPTLLELRKKYHLGIITNGRAVKQWDKLIRLGVHHFFELVVISEEVGFEKPAKEIFESALKQAKCKASETVMIGDKESDFAAKNVGMKVIDVKKLENFSEILDNIKDL